MTMMTCPKCGFEQPQDQFCAKCGVNIQSFKPQIGLGAGLSYLLKPIAFVIVIIGLIFLLFKSVENRIIPPEIIVEETTQIGSGASSLKMNHPQANQERNDKVSEVEPVASRLKLEPTETNIAPAKDAQVPIAKFDQVTANFSLAEHGVEESNGKNWFLVPVASPLNSSVSEEVVLKKGNNTFEFVDELIVYDLNFFIEEITEKEVSIKLNIKRTLRARTQNGAAVNSFSLNEKVPLGQTLIIIDALPRRASIDRPNSILSTIYKSQSFLSRATELVQIIKFENPSNSPQEELTP